MLKACMMLKSPEDACVYWIWFLFINLRTHAIVGREIDYVNDLNDALYTELSFFTYLLFLCNYVETRMMK